MSTHKLACLAAQISLLAIKAAFPVKLHRPNSHDSLHNQAKMISSNGQNALGLVALVANTASGQLQPTCASTLGLLEG